VREIVLNDNFRVPYVEIQPLAASTVPGARRQVAATTATIVAEGGKSGIDFELRNHVSTLEERMQKSMTAMSEFRDSIEGKIRGKADAQGMDRIMDKVRTELRKMGEKQLQLERGLMARVDRDEAETLIEHVLATSRVNSETAAGSQPLDCLMCGRPKTAVSPYALPVLESAHDTVFGKGQPTRSSLSALRPLTGQRTQRLPIAFSGRNKRECQSL
jgi:hypothetical protein